MPEEQAPDNVLDRLQELSKRAKGGDLPAQKSLNELLDQHPALWMEMGNLAEHAEHAWIRQIAEDDPLAMTSLHRFVKHMRAELWGPEPRPLERLLARRVTATWLQMQVADVRAAQPGLSERVSTFLAAEQDRAQARYLMALKALHTFQRLMPAQPVAARAKFTARTSAGKKSTMASDARSATERTGRKRRTSREVSCAATGAPSGELAGQCEAGMAHRNRFKHLLEPAGTTEPVLN